VFWNPPGDSPRPVVSGNRDSEFDRSNARTSETRSKLMTFRLPSLCGNSGCNDRSAYGSRSVVSEAQSCIGKVGIHACTLRSMKI